MFKTRLVSTETEPETSDVIDDETEEFKVAPERGRSVAKVVKLFTAVSYDFQDKLERLSLASLNRLMFVVKAGASPNETPFRCSTLG